MDNLCSFRGWFFAAAVYNLLWGVWVVLYPRGYFEILGMPVPSMLALWQSVGMIVGVYAIGYWLVARDPVRYGAFALIGLLGKVFGPIGFVWTALRGELPWVFGWINVTNDLIWLPAFGVFCWRWWRVERVEGRGP